MKYDTTKGVSAGSGKSGRKARAAVKQKIKRRAKKNTHWRDELSPVLDPLGKDR